MKHKINIIKKIDGLLGSFLLKILPEVKWAKSPGNIRKVLVVRPGGMGDAALLLPVIKEVKLKFPEIKIDILCESRNSGIFSATPYVDDIMLYDNIGSILTLFRRKFDIIIDTEQSHFLSAIFCRFLRGYYRVGFDVFDRGRLFNNSIVYSHELYEAQSFHNLFRHIFDLPERSTLNPPYFKEETIKKKNDEIFISGKGKKIVCVFTGATIDERLWPEKRWAEVVESLCLRDCYVVLLGGDTERVQCQTILSLCKSKNAIDMSGQLSILETGWLFLRSILLISTDSGILHLGVLSDIPTVSLFGSGIAQKWAPKGHHHIVINKDLECSPCTQFGSTPECLNKNACMISITSEDIIEAAHKLL